MSQRAPSRRRTRGAAVPLERHQPLFSLYHELSRDLPFTLPATPEEFESALFRELSDASDAVGLAWKEGGRLTGFVRAYVDRHTSPGVCATTRYGNGAIPYLFARTRSAADGLVQQCMEQFRRLGVDRVAAFDEGTGSSLSFFNGGYEACPESLPQTTQALARAGFTIAMRELTLILEEEDLIRLPRPTALPAGFEFAWSVRDPEKTMDLGAVAGETRVGFTLGRRMSLRQAHPLAREHGYIDWLGVDAEYQRRGIGRALLLKMLHRLRSIGCRRIFLTTGSQNWRAQPLYLALGFQVVGSAVTMVREEGRSVV